MNLINFNYGGDSVTTIVDDKQEPWFVASHVCKILNLSNTSQVLKDNCDQEGIRDTEALTKGGMQKVKIINEPNLYRLMFKSKEKKAKLFQKWVFKEVLPSLRKTGEYSIPKKLKKQSTENRTMLTDAWKECGIEKKHHFIQLTLQEYKSLGLEAWKRKHNMNKEEILLLSALESMEMLKLFYDKKDGFYECRDSLNDTAKMITSDIRKKQINNIKESLK